MFICKRLARITTGNNDNSSSMFSRFNDVLQSAADVLAPPPTPLQDFQYHWKQVKTFYNSPNTTTIANIPPTTSASTHRDDATANNAATTPPSTLAHQQPTVQHRHRCHLDDTRIPHHLEQMLQLLIREEQLNHLEPSATVAPATPNPPAPPTTAPTPQPCLDFLLGTRPLDILVDLAATDTPPGARVCILTWLRRFLSCMRRPHLGSAAVLEPVQRLLQLCHGGRASPYETEEILFAATVAGLVRQEPFLMHLFLPAHQHTAFVRRRLAAGTEAATSLATAVVAPRRSSATNPLFEMPGMALRGKVSLVSVNDNVDAVDGNALGNESKQRQSDAGRTFACDCKPDEDRFALLDTILAYAESPDALVVLRACEGALMLATLPTLVASDCAAVAASLRLFAERVAERLAGLCARIPEDMDTGDIEECTVSWGLLPRDPSVDLHFVGRAQLLEFLGWLDYTNCLANEASPVMAAELCRHVRLRLLGDCIEPQLLDEHAAFMLVLLAKIVHQLDARPMAGELANWLIGCDVASGAAGDCLLNIIIDMAQDNAELLLPTLQFVESLIVNCNERILHGMLFRYVNTRGYYDAQAAGEVVQTWSDEEDERAREAAEKREALPVESADAVRGVDSVRLRSRTMAPTYILKVINNFLLLLPRQIMSSEAIGTCYEEYVQDASRHYQNWVHRTLDFGWPTEASFPPFDDCHVTVVFDATAVSDEDVRQHHDNDDIREHYGGAGGGYDLGRSSSLPTLQLLDRQQHWQQQQQQRHPTSMRQSHHQQNRQCNDSGICEETFYEGPLLRLLFQHVRNMATHPYEFNLAVIAIVSKLALLPHPFLHEILLDPEVPVARGTHTLWTSMQSLARQLLLEVPRREGFQRKVAETSKRLLTNPPMMCEPQGDADPVFESLVVLEEFCKELAAIAFVKYHHATE